MQSFTIVVLWNLPSKRENDKFLFERLEKKNLFIKKKYLWLFVLLELSYEILENWRLRLWSSTRPIFYLFFLFLAHFCCWIIHGGRELLFDLQSGRLRGRLLGGGSSELEDGRGDANVSLEERLHDKSRGHTCWQQGRFGKKTRSSDHGWVYLFLKIYSMTIKGRESQIKIATFPRRISVLIYCWNRKINM